MKWRVEALRNGVPIGTINTISGHIKQDSTAKIKLALSLQCDDLSINLYKNIRKTGEGLHPSEDLVPSEILVPYDDSYTEETTSFSRLADRISPVAIASDGTEERQGVFMIVTDPLTITGSSRLTNLELYDESYKLDQSSFSTRHYYAAGTLYTDAVRQILTELDITLQYIVSSTLTISVDREFPIGTNCLTALNTLLDEINYEDLFFDGNGYACCVPITEKSVPEFKYIQDESDIVPSIKKVLDIYGLPNVFVGMVSNPDKSVMTYTKENHDLSSELSIERRGYRLAKVYTPDDMASATALQNYIEKQYMETEAVTETITFPTSVELGHGFKNLCQIETDDISGLYTETAWDIDMSTAGQMNHTFKKKVTV